VRNPTGLYPSLKVDTAGTGVVSNAGATLLVATMARVGLDRALSAALGRWCRPTAIHDPGKIVGDLAIAVALGGDCLADIATVRAEPAVFGLVASDPTVSRLIDTLARDADKALAAIAAARARARAGAWKLAGAHAPGPWHQWRSSGDRRCGRDVGDRAFGQGEGGADVQAGLRLPPAVRVCRSRCRGHRRTPIHPAATG
jgi:hypothetical protein